MVLEVKIASEAQRLKLKYFGDQSLEMAVSAPVPPTYRGLSGEEAVEADEDLYWILRLGPLYLYQLYSGGGYRRGGGGSGGGKLLEGLDIRSRELEYARYFYESFFRVFIRNLAERERVLGLIAKVEINFEDTRIGVKSTVKRKESLLDEAVEEESKLELVLGELGLSRNKIVERTRQTSGDEVRAKTPRSGRSAQPNLTTSKIAHKFSKRQIKKVLSVFSATVSGEVTQGKRRRVESLGGSGEKVAEGQSVSVDDLKEVEVRAKLGILQGKKDTSQMEEEEDAGVLGVVDGLDGVSPQIVLDNQGDDVEVPEDGSEKVVKEMSLRINDIESGLAREIGTSKALLSAQTELRVELDESPVREDHALMCNQKFVEQFYRMKEANENWEDQFLKVHFRLEKLNQVVSDLTRQVEEKDFGIKKGLKDLSEATERPENLQCQVDALAARAKQVDMAQYRIRALERTEELCQSDLNSSRIELEQMRQEFIGKDDELRVA
ncbi:hypothetical protein GIB67_031825 [Kingdonia uniflora]|uniref:Uncharacterized protein n=1 Tax=Kingdonia uniflora TaxID=39325 RepID=A0A7J7L4J5_9MAGN|nr:hypothetical protein GIB67_031825 [Kingdonia uniflora]